MSGMTDNADPNYPLKFPPTFRRMEGAQLIASYFNTFLFGVGTLYAIRYINKYAKRDHWMVRGVVAILWTLAALETCFSAAQAYGVLVTHWGYRSQLAAIRPVTPAAWSCLYLAAFVAQIYLASRIWIIGRACNNRWGLMTIPVVLLALLQISGGFIIVGLFIKCKVYPKLSEYPRISTIGNVLHSTGAAGADVCITIGLIGLLKSEAGTGKFVRKNWWHRLAHLFINRALATSILSILATLLFHYTSGTYYFLLPLLANTHVYFITVLSILMSRDGTRKEMDRSVHFSELVFNLDTDTQHQATDGSSSSKHTDTTKKPDSSDEDLHKHVGIENASHIEEKVSTRGHD